MWMIGLASNRSARHLRREIWPPQHVCSSSFPDLAVRHLYREISPPQPVASSTAVSSPSTLHAKVQLGAASPSILRKCVASAHRLDPRPRLLPRAQAIVRTNPELNRCLRVDRRIPRNA